MQLLKFAETTATSLSDMALCVNEEDVKNGMNHLQSIQSQYMKTVSEMHSLLKPHAEFIQAYQAPTRMNRMYLQRVELRIAESKRSILEEFLRLQQLENGSKISVTEVGTISDTSNANANKSTTEVTYIIDNESNHYQSPIRFYEKKKRGLV
jgi:hypothetical protein